jgi:putative protease
MEIEIGRVTHYFNHINVAVLRLDEILKLGDRVHFVGHSTDFVQTVSSMEVNHHTILAVEPGDDVAIKVIEPVHEHDVVFRIAEVALAR